MSGFRDDDFTVCVRYRNRHAFEHVEPARCATWEEVALPLVDIIAPELVQGDNKWTLIARTKEGVSKPLALDQPARYFDTLRTRSGLMEVFAVPAGGDATEADVVEVRYVPSEQPVQLPRSLIDYIDHLRPTSQVS